MILKPLFARMKEVFGCVPENYLVVDLETSGFDPTKDVILQVGHCVVKDRQVVDRGSFLLDWTQGRGPRWHNHAGTQQPQAGPDLAWLQARVAETEKQIRAQGKQFHTTWERLCAEGHNPWDILEEYRTWFKEVSGNGWFLLTHNGYAFDIKFFDNHFDRFLNRPGKHFDCSIFDTGAILKAAQLPTLPHAGETPETFARRVASVRRKGLRWSLSEYAVPRFGLEKKHDLDPLQAHDAGYDAYVTHLLFEHLRELSEAE